jgi:hypothetical protein
MRKKNAFLQSKPSNSSHKTVIVASPLVPQKQSKCFLMRKCPACSTSTLLPVAKPNVEREFTTCNKQRVFADFDKKGTKRKKRRSSLAEAILKMRGNTPSTNSSPSLKDFLSST